MDRNENSLGDFIEDDVTKINLTHIGLTLDFECFTICEKGWKFYFGESLYDLLTVERGNPFKNSSENAEWQTIKEAINF